MVSRNLIAPDITALLPSDKVKKALRLMDDYHVRHLPVVENGKLTGVLDENDILDADEKALVKEFVSANRIPFLLDNKYHYDAVKAIVDYNLTILPVVDKEYNYLGVITLESLIKQLAETSATSIPGGVLLVEMDPREYAMSNIARIVESEGAQILSCFISSPANSEKLEITLKVNRQDLKYIVSTFERYQYTVKETYDESDYTEFLKERYEMLMNYLSV